MRRISLIDLIRFFAAIMVVYVHTASFRFIKDPANCEYFHFHSSFIFVELFLLISGYFTANHFSKTLNNDDTLEKKSKISLKYTWCKFKVLIPYCLFSIFLTATINVIWEPGNLKGILLSTIPETLLIAPQNLLVVPLWYLVMLLLFFPVFSIICQSKNKTFISIITAIVFVFFYSNFTHIYNSGMFGDYARIIMGLMSGRLLYYLVIVIKKINFSLFGRILINIITFLALIILVKLLLSPDIISRIRYPEMTVAMIMFIVLLALILSGQTILSKIQFSFFVLLGKLSLPIYIMHWP
ncbi:acyltransferase, partial [Candidatus Saccharibacteria bacterium]|nr:acyltransferase [Candidatus Saccharibacteria bacterium]